MIRPYGIELLATPDRSSTTVRYRRAFIMLALQEGINVKDIALILNRDYHAITHLRDKYKVDQAQTELEALLKHRLTMCVAERTNFEAIMDSIRQQADMLFLEMQRLMDEIEKRQIDLKKLTDGYE